MKVLVVFNKHRNGGGSDVVAQTTVDLLNAQSECQVVSFVRDSRKLSGVGGNLRAFVSGCYAREAVRAFSHVLDVEKPDVVHAHEIYPLISPWIFKQCRVRNIPIVMTCHDYRMSCPVATHFHDGQLCYECCAGGNVRCVINNCCDSLGKSIAYALRNVVASRYRLFVDYVDLFLTPSEAAKKVLVEHAKLPEDLVAVLPNIVSSVHSFSPRMELGDYIAFAGRMSPEKGVDILIHAARMSGYSLKLAGDFSGHPLLDDNDPMIEFVGQLERSDIESFYAAARCVVVPSIWCETFGLVAAEAMACGTPVIVSDMGALPEVVGDCGLVVNSGDSVGLAQRITELFSNDELCRSLGAKGRKRIERTYNAASHLDALMDYYRKVMKG